MTVTELAGCIEKRIREIPASNPGVIAMYPTTLANVLDRSLLRKIALEAAAEAVALTAGKSQNG